MLFFWAPYFGEQIALVPLIQSLHPSLMVISPGNSYERAEAFPAAYSGKLTELLLAVPQAAMTFISWPWANKQAEARTKAISNWGKSPPLSPQRKIRVLNYANFHNYGGVQVKNTWHYTCAGRHNGRSGKLHGIKAFENCTDVVDTSLIRIVLTFALS